MTHHLIFCNIFWVCNIFVVSLQFGVLGGFLGLLRKGEQKTKPQEYTFSRCNDRKVLETWNKDLFSKMEVIDYERKIIGRAVKTTHEFLTTKILFQDKRSMGGRQQYTLIYTEIKVLKHGQMGCVVRIRTMYSGRIKYSSITRHDVETYVPFLETSYKQRANEECHFQST